MLVQSRRARQRAAPGGGAAATTLQKRTLWKSVISAVSWPSRPTSAERRGGQRRATVTTHAPSSRLAPPLIPIEPGRSHPQHQMVQEPQTPLLLAGASCSRRTIYSRENKLAQRDHNHLANTWHKR